MKHITAILYSYCSGPWWSHSWETMLYLRGSAVNWSHLHSGDFSKVCLIGGELANLDTNSGLFSEGEKKRHITINWGVQGGDLFWYADIMEKTLVSDSHSECLQLFKAWIWLRLGPDPFEGQHDQFFIMKSNGYEAMGVTYTMC